MRRRALALGLTGLLAFTLAGASVYAWARDDPSQAASAPPSSARAERGRALFLSKGCAACHHLARQDIVTGLGAAPDLSGLPYNAGQRVEGQSAEEYVRVAILNPDAYYAPGYGGPFGMPQIPLTSDEIGALVAFLLDDGEAGLREVRMALD